VEVDKAVASEDLKESDKKIRGSLSACDGKCRYLVPKDAQRYVSFVFFCILLSLILLHLHQPANHNSTATAAVGRR
jgi:hypothetical protein